MPFFRDIFAKSRKRIGWIMGESLLIILSVLLGLLANDWRVDQENKKMARTALEAIHQELQGNYDQLSHLLPYHRMMDDSMEILSTQITSEHAHMTFADFSNAMPEGFTVPLLNKTAWELARNTGAINHLDFKLVMELAQLYRLQDFLQGKIDMIGHNLYVAGNIDPADFSATILAIGSLANDIVIQEGRLVEKYPEMMDKLEP